MTDLTLKLACWDYDRTRPLIDGRVKPEGIKLDIEVLRPRQMFPRMLEHQEFDASEISLASHASLIGRGGSPFVAIPVMLSKIFRHSCFYVRVGSGIEKPEDLRGKRVGTTQFSATATTFMKGMLQHEYGVAQHEMHWFMGGLDAPTQAPLIPFTPPPGVTSRLVGFRSQCAMRRSCRYAMPVAASSAKRSR
jgi:4,5-dihydroxyphthalate decarboxylase